TSRNRWCRLFVWANGMEEEDMTGKHETENSIEYWKMNMGWMISAIEAEIRILKVGLELVIWVEPGLVTRVRPGLVDLLGPGLVLQVGSGLLVLHWTL
ncbi:hypothetical protein S83_063810, partial [Arachis hypogaea]